MITPGRIVHFTDDKGKTLPAIVIQGDEPLPAAVGATVIPQVENRVRCLKVFGVFGDFIDFEVPFSEAPKARTWRFPPKV